MRSLISTIIALIALATSVEAKMLRLLVFKAPRCGPCLQFDRDYSQDASLRNALKMFECVPAFTSAKPEHNATFERYGVSVVPTFIVTLGDGTEVGRVNGYKGKQDLMAGLIRVSQRARSMPSRPSPPPRRKTTPPAEQPSIRKPSLSDDQIDMLRMKNRDLTEKVYNLEEEVIREKKITQQIRQRLEAEVEATKKQLKEQTGVDPERMTALQNRIYELQRQLNNPANGNTDKTAPTPVPVAEPQQPPQRGLLKSVFHHGVALALDVGLSSAQAEVLVPIAAASGPIGIGAVAGLWLLKKWKKRRGRSRGDPFPPESPQTPPPAPYPPQQHDEPREITRYEQVPVDDEAKRIRRAMQIVSDRYPKTAGWTNLVEEAVRLIKSGETR